MIVRSELARRIWHALQGTSSHVTNMDTLFSILDQEA